MWSRVTERRWAHHAERERCGGKGCEVVAVARRLRPVRRWAAGSCRRTLGAGSAKGVDRRVERRAPARLAEGAHVRATAWRRGRARNLRRGQNVLGSSEHARTVSDQKRPRERGGRTPGSARRLLGPAPVEWGESAHLSFDCETHKFLSYLTVHMCAAWLTPSRAKLTTLGPAQQPLGASAASQGFPTHIPIHLPMAPATHASPRLRPVPLASSMDTMLRGGQRCVA